jgi:hypothetical protein
MPACRNHWLICLGVVFASASLVPAQQQADPEFEAKVDKPAYTANGPRVLFDEAHHNFHKTKGRYKPFAELIRNDGYQITRGREPFSTDLLKDYDLVVIANALGAEQLGARDAANPAFTEAESDALRDWVKNGGSLLLITDHYPTGPAAKPLADRFGVLMSMGMTEEYEFTIENGLAADHPVIRGRGPEEAVKTLRSFTGQSIQGPEGSVSLMTLPENGRERTPDPVDPHGKPPIEGSLKYRSQAVAFEFGKGRVVVLGEAAMLTAQVNGSEKFGMNQPGIDNRQFALNAMHWLSRLLP